MTDYVKSTNFASKDSLAIGNPLKIVKGTEIDTEFNNIATAVATKADLNSPSFIGTPQAPTPAAGNSTTLLATTAFVANAITAATTAVIQAAYPVGSIYINATNATNPAALLGFGTWVAFGAGRVPVGFDAGDGLFNAAEKTGGTKDATLVSHSHSVSASGSTGGQSAGHTHTFSGTTSGAGAHSHSVTAGWANGAVANAPAATENLVAPLLTYSTSGVGDHSHSYSGTTSGGSSDHTHSVSVSGSTSTNGSSATNANLPPFITVYMWKRTA